MTEEESQREQWGIVRGNVRTFLPIRICNADVNEIKTEIRTHITDIVQALGANALGSVPIIGSISPIQ